MGIFLRKMKSELKEFTRLIHFLKKEARFLGVLKFLPVQKKLGEFFEPQNKLGLRKSQKQPEPSLQDSVNGECWDSHGSHVF